MDASGDVTLLRLFDPFGEILTQEGEGDFAWGYFGGLLDATTGLVLETDYTMTRRRDVS